MPPPSSPVTQNRSEKFPTTSSGSRLVTTTSPTNQGGQGGSEAPMESMWDKKKASVGITGSQKAYAWVETHLAIELRKSGIVFKASTGT